MEQLNTAVLLRHSNLKAKIPSNRPSEATQQRQALTSVIFTPFAIPFHNDYERVENE
jgi:hypothetical protein